MQKSNESKNVQPPQHQEQQPGIESEMTPRPAYEGEKNDVFSKLAGKVAIITGGDSGIGRAVAVAFARHGANVVISYLNEHEDAKETKWKVEEEGQQCHLIPGDIGSEAHCQKIVDEAIAQFGRLDILVNNAAVQFPQDSLEDITEEQLEKTFRTNIFSQFFMAKAALKHLPKGGTIINTTSVTAYRGSGHLLDYASTKGAIVAFTRSLAQSVADKGIRVNGVAPGPIWTPLIPATFPEGQVASFGSDVPLKRAGQPEEVAPCYVFLASEDSSYMTGQVLHPNGGEIING
ncbi:SDR family oxidoreductase [Pedobacter sp. SYSU D00535]|uniref:SDR family oxidoreductase n=1 Tax=Pedobacter sp. SYSU D00535 TaxID=2810308 RepID=UPI001A973ABF|nr:SDR family oxidoreductase [Pedobacter sp. SYSU D00535]